MSSPVLNQDMIIEIMSRLPASEVGKFRLLNKECNKISYESWFVNLNLRRTNSISGYIIQYKEGIDFQTSFVHDRTDIENNRLSIDFLPPGKVKIAACDAIHGILLCVVDTGPCLQYIVCKPTTKQYQVIPNPKLQYFSFLFSLAVTQSNPFRYKILRFFPVSRGKFTCQVFDSHSFTWKISDNFHVPKKDRIIISQPVQASGFLNWFSRNSNVIRFCLKSETWSFMQLPNLGSFPKLVRYEGKLGIIRWSTKGREELHRLWVSKGSFEKSWVRVKDIKNMGITDEVLWMPRNDVVTLCSWGRVCFYNINTEKLDVIDTKTEFAKYVCFPFCSDYESIDLNERRDGPTSQTQ